MLHCLLIPVLLVKFENILIPLCVISLSHHLDSPLSLVFWHFMWCALDWVYFHSWFLACGAFRLQSNIFISEIFSWLISLMIHIILIVIIYIILVFLSFFSFYFLSLLFGLRFGRAPQLCHPNIFIDFHFCHNIFLSPRSLFCLFLFCSILFWFYSYISSYF